MGAGFGSFVDGLFSGAKSVGDLRKQYDDLQTQFMRDQAAADLMKQGNQQPQTALPQGTQQPGFGTTGTGDGSGGGGGGGDGSGGGGGGGGSGSGSGAGGWGPLAYQAADYFRGQGYSEAAIQGILANGLGEGGFNSSWAPSGIKGEASFGPWQFHQGGELGPYQNWAAQNGVKDYTQFQPQMQYLDNWIKTNMPDYLKIQDPKAATDQFLSQFERPAAQYNYPGARYGQLATVQRYMHGGEGGGYAAPPTPGAPPQTALATPGLQGQMPTGSEGNAPGPVTGEGGVVVPSAPAAAPQMVQGEGGAMVPAPAAPAPAPAPAPAQPAPAQPPTAPRTAIAPQQAALPPVGSPAEAAAAARAGYPATPTGVQEWRDSMQQRPTVAPAGSQAPAAPGPVGANTNPNGVVPGSAVQPVSYDQGPMAPVSTAPIPQGSLAFGDSIGGGFIRHGGLAGNASGNPNDPDAATADGRSAANVTKRLAKIPDGSLAGVPGVVLSTGLSNSPGAIGEVEKQIGELKRAGVPANRIRLVGVGNRAGSEGTHHYNLAPLNPQLARIAAKTGVQWGGPLPAVVHPDVGYYGSNVRGS
jgi:hypothetical protein